MPRASLRFGCRSVTGCTRRTDHSNRLTTDIKRQQVSFDRPVPKFVDCGRSVILSGLARAVRLPGEHICSFTRRANITNTWLRHSGRRVPTREKRRERAAVRIEVDSDLCVGAGQCVLTAAEVFDQRDVDGVPALIDSMSRREWHEAVREAAMLCTPSANRVVE